MVASWSGPVTYVISFCICEYMMRMIKIGPKDLCSLALKKLGVGVGSGRGGILYIHLQLHVNKLIIKIQISRNTN